jgi:hypothetical protein
MAFSSELAAPLGVCPLSQLTQGVGGSSCLLLPGGVAVLCCCIGSLPVSLPDPARCVANPCSVTEYDYPALTSCSRRVVSWLGRDGVTSVGRGHFRACQTISSATRLTTIRTKSTAADIWPG